jgi:hypothetical protein
MNDRPTAAELVAGVRQYLEAELLPTLTDQRLKFQTLVAANVLAIAERELLSEEDHVFTELAWLAPLVDQDTSLLSGLSAEKHALREANRRLCQRIGRGEFDAPAKFNGLLKKLRHCVEQKLRVANPRYLAAFAST